MKNSYSALRAACRFIVLTLAVLFSTSSIAQLPNCGYATSQVSPVNSGICVLCGVQNPGNSVDADTTNFATVTAAVNGIGYFGQLLKFSNPYLIGDSVSVVLEIPGQLVSANLIGGIRLQTYAGNAPVGPVILAGDPLLRLQLLGGGTNKFRITFAASANFDGVGISINGTVALLSSLRIYTAQAFAPAPRIALPLGIQANAQTSPLYNGVCVLCSVRNPSRAADRDTATFSTITPAVGAIGYVSQLVKFPGSFRAGDSISLLLRIPGNLADVQVLGGIRVETYLGNTPSGNPRFLTGLARIELLTNNGKMRVTFAAGDNFDGVAIGVNGVASALSSLEIYDAAVTSSSQMILTICTGTSAQIAVTTPAAANISWYTAANGGSAIATGPVFTSPPLITSTTYYAEASRNGCTYPVRTTIVVNPVAVPAAPVVTPSTLNICPGDSVFAVAANPGASLITWYTVPNGGSAVSSGDTLSIPGPATNTTYYAQAANGGCVSGSRTPLTVNVGTAPSNVIVAPPSATIVGGQTASFTATSDDPVAVYHWYTQATGGSPIFTGNDFTTPLLNASTTYYLQANSATGCSAAARIAVPVTVNNAGNNTSCDRAASQSSNVNGTCIGCFVTNASSATDSDSTSYSTLRVTAGLLGGYVSQSLRFPFLGDAGDTVRIGVHFIASVTDVALLSGLEIASYNAAAYNNDRTSVNNALVTVNILPGGEDAILNFVPQAAFDRIEVRLNSGAASVVNQAGIRYAVRIKPAATVTPAVPASCSGSPVTLTATGNANTVFKWYDAATGGNLLFTGNAFTTPALSVSTTYYVASTSNTGCEQTVRVPVLVTVNPSPAKPVPVATQINTCAGTTATANIQSPDPSLTYRWYSVSAGGTPIASGTGFTSGVLTSDTAFYVEAVNAGGCASNERARIDVSVSPSPTAPTAAATSAIVCSGNSSMLSVTNPLPGYTYQWFAASSGGAALATGNTFTTPALGSTTTYYVSAVSAQGCSSTRTAVTTNVNPLPAAPSVSVTPAGTLNPGQTATLTVNAPIAGITYHYYLQSSGGVPVATGNSFTTPALSGSTAYYVEAVSAEGCANPTRTIVNIPVNVLITLNCDAPTSQSSNVNGICVGCTVTNNANAVDNDNTTASQLNMAVAITNATISQTLIFPSVSEAGDSLSILIGLPVGVLAVNLGTALQLETFNGVTSNGDVTNANAASVVIYPRGANQYLLRYAPPALFDRVSLTINSNILALFTTLEIYAASRQAGPPKVNNSSVPVCAGGNAVLSVAPAANILVNWYTTPVGGVAVASGDVFTVTGVAANTVYYAEATRISNNCTNSNRVPVQVIVNPAPAAPVVVNGSLTVCPGTTTDLFISNPSSSLTYQWFADATGGVALGTGASFTTPAINSNITYYAEASNATGCASNTRTPVTITIASATPVPVVTGNTGICEGTGATLIVTNPQSGATYQFFNTASGGSVLATGTTFTTPPLQGSRNYYVEATGAQSCIAGGARTQIPVSVNAAPAAPAVLMTNVTACSGSPATLTVSSPQNNLTYQWYDAGTGGSVIYTGASITTAPVTSNTVLYVQANSAAGCGSTSRTAVSVQPSALPATPSVTNVTGTVCEGTKAQLLIQSPEGGLTYDWYDAATGGNLVYTGETYNTAALRANTTFYVSARNSNGCSSERIPVTVSVTPAADAPVVLPVNPSIITGGSTTLSISNPQPGFTYRFYDANGVLLSTGTSYNTGALNTTTVFLAEAVNTSGCAGPVRTRIIVTVGGVPLQPIVTGNNTTICANTSANLSIANPETGVTYNWYSQPTGGTPLFSSAAVTTPLLTQTTKYYVEGVRNGLTSARTEVVVTVNPRPSAPVISPIVVESCSVAPVTLNIQNPAAGTTYNWYNVPVDGIPFGTGNSYVIQQPQTGVLYTDAVNSFGCVSLTRTSVQITVLPVLSAPVASIDSRTPTTIVFRWTAVPGATGYEYSIDGGLNFSTPSSGANGLTHTAREITPGTSITFMVRATGSIPCQTSSVSNTLTGDTDNPLGNDLFIPNSFTPNGDGRNDKFRAFGNQISAMEISIYTQWGNLIYHQANDTNGWDGTAGGRLQPVGVYVYIINLTLRDGTRITRKGSVNLIR